MRANASTPGNRSPMVAELRYPEGWWPDAPSSVHQAFREKRPRPRPPFAPSGSRYSWSTAWTGCCAPTRTRPCSAPIPAGGCGGPPSSNACGGRPATANRLVAGIRSWPASGSTTSGTRTAPGWRRTASPNRSKPAPRPPVTGHPWRLRHHAASCLSSTTLAHVPVVVCGAHPERVTPGRDPAIAEVAGTFPDHISSPNILRSRIVVVATSSSRSITDKFPLELKNPVQVRPRSVES
jgi:hypothetical protein